VHAVTFALYLHLLAMATFVGGQLVLGLAVVPGLKGRDREGLRAVARRFGWMSLAALAVLLVTGAWMASDRDLWSDSTLHLKLTLFVVAGGLILWHLKNGAAHWLQGAILLVSLVIVWLGVSL
jgi:uncharacterized membrane protein